MRIFCPICPIRYRIDFAAPPVPPQENDTRHDADLIDAFVMDGDEVDARLWEIAENLHRAELTVQERADQIAEWIKLVEKKSGATCATFGRGQKGGLRDAVRELGVDRTEAQRAVKIASITEEAKEAAREEVFGR